MANWHWTATTAAAIGFVIWSVAGGDGASAKSAAQPEAKRPATQARAPQRTRYQVRPDRPALPSAPLRSGAGAPATPELQPESDTDLPNAEQVSGGLRGEVTSADGEPRVAWFVIALDPRTGDRHRAVTGAGGGFALVNLSPGDYEVWTMPASRARLRALSQPDEVATATIVAGQDEYLHLVGPVAEASTPAVAAGLGQASGILLDASGSPIVGAQILAAPAGEGHWSFASFQTTDDQGRFTLHGLPPGQVRVNVVGLPGDPPAPVTADVDGDPVTIRLD